MTDTGDQYEPAYERNPFVPDPAGVLYHLNTKSTVDALNGLADGNGQHKAGLPAYRRFSDVKLETVEWLWPNRIPAGKLTMLAGNPGEGKSFFTCDVAARLSRGTTWPDEDETDRKPCSAIILNAEDRPEDTIGPRLKAADADLERVYTLDAVTTIDKGVPGQKLFSISEDIAALEKMLDEIADVRLVIIDPITAYMGTADGNSNTEVRSVLALLSALAGRRSVACLLVTHMNKRGSDSPAVQRTLGSIGFTAAVRAQHFLLRDKGDPKRRLLIPSKASLGVEAAGLAFTIQSHPDGPRLAWEEAEINMSVDEAMAQAAEGPGAGRPPKELGAAEAFVREYLAGGPKLSSDLDEAAKMNGHAKRTIMRARSALGVTARKTFSGWVVSLAGGESAGGGSAVDGRGSEPPELLESGHGIPV